jgi:DNA primase
MSKSPKSPLDDLNLISSAEYYSSQFPGIETNGKFAKVLCPFHDDTRPSLSINLEDGWYRCFSCGAKGGGIVKFHMAKFGLNFKQTIKELEVLNVI